MPYDFGGPLIMRYAWTTIVSVFITVAAIFFIRKTSKINAYLFLISLILLTFLVTYLQ